jgi:hypothetical protein
MRYLLAYFALAIGMSGLSLLFAGSALGFFLILVAAGLIYLLVRVERQRRRERRFGEYGPAIEGYEQRFAIAAKSLDEKLPEDALDNAALVELLTAYEDDEGEALRQEYGQLRERFLAWQREFERLHAEHEAGAIGLPARFAEQYDRLDRELPELFAEVERLEARAAEVDRASDDPLDEIARAALKLQEAQASCRRAFRDAVPAELQRQLALADEKLAQARAALAKGAERPLAAARLAREVRNLAVEVTRRAGELAKRPVELAAARAQVKDGCERLTRQIPDAKAKLASAAGLYAPSCLLEIQGVGAAAEQALERARSLAADDLRLSEAEESLARATHAVKRIEEHLASLERAAGEARHEVEHAELEVDRAWANVTAGSTTPEALQRAERIAARGRELAADARKEIEQARPDWFRAIALAQRAKEVVQELPLHTDREQGDAATGVEHARARAELALAQARTLLASADNRLTGMDNMTSLFLDRGEYAYRQGVALQEQLPGAEDPEALAHAAIDGFRLAEDAAAAVQEHAFGLRGVDGSKRSGTVTAAVVWGAVATAFRPD